MYYGMLRVGTPYYKTEKVAEKDLLYRVYTCAANCSGPAPFTRTELSAVLARVYTRVSANEPV